MIFKKNKTRAFTLIELLMVIVIISLLSSIVMSSLNSARAKARNAARLAGVLTLINAFNLSISSSGSLPSTSGSWACVSDSCYEGFVLYVANGDVNAFLAPSLPQKPSDPVGGRGYGGFLYINPYTPPIGIYTGQPGAYIVYLLEPEFSCPRGTLWASTANFTECIEKIDQN